MSFKKPGSFGDVGFPDIIKELELCVSFLANFQDETNGSKKYLRSLTEISQRANTDVEISLDDVLSFEGNEQFVHRIEKNTLRYVELFSRAADSLMPEDEIDLETADAFDVWLFHRKSRIAAQPQDRDDPNTTLPSVLTRKFEVRIIPRDIDKDRSLRNVKAEDVGSLVKVRGIVTKITDVQPKVQVVTYICYACGNESYQTTPGTSYRPLDECPSAMCKQNQTTGKLYAHTRGSKFQKYQEIKIQELPDQVPVGNIPRSMLARTFGSLTRQVVPGDLVTVSGIFLLSRKEGFWHQGLTCDTYLHITSCTNHRKKNVFELTATMREEIEKKSEEKDIYDQLSSSIAPEILGHSDVKKALLLLLTSGVTRKMKDGMSIRGDINVLLVGDPGVAKSQLLKQISKITPRGIYTTGKGTSGVGLTAAVSRDKITGEMTLEGGALVLADMGICCIDEFDKMEEGDRTAIHEVMEQQSVSIAKAGITTTLNARTAILAAANPIYGRWNKKYSFEDNVNLETALLSRFDLIFVLLDKPDDEHDEMMARHVCYVHREGKHPPLHFKAFSHSFLRGYLARAREFQPYLPKNLTDYIVGTYVSMRAENTGDSLDLDQNSYRGGGGGGGFTSRWARPRNDRKRFCTPRLLLSILRLSQALARLYFRDTVIQSDVDEAIRLMNVSRAAGGDDEPDGDYKDDYQTAIYVIITKYAKDHKKNQVLRTDILPRVLARGHTEEKLDETLETYEELAIWSLTRDKLKIRFLKADEAS